MTEQTNTNSGPAADNKGLALLKSRKFWAALVGLGMVVLKTFKPDLPLQDDQVLGLVYVVVAYILGTSLEDGLKRI